MKHNKFETAWNFQFGANIIECTFLEFLVDTPNWDCPISNVDRQL